MRDCSFFRRGWMTRILSVGYLGELNALWEMKVRGFRHRKPTVKLGISVSSHKENAWNALKSNPFDHRKVYLGRQILFINRLMTAGISIMTRCEGSPKGRSVRICRCLCTIRVLREQSLSMCAAGALVHCSRSVLSARGSGLCGWQRSCVEGPLPVPCWSGSWTDDKGSHEMKNTSFKFKEAEY